MYKKYNNILLEASMEDHRNDCIITTFTLISILLSLKGINWFDSVVGICISAWICKTGIEIFIESYNILMDVSIDEDTKEPMHWMYYDEYLVMLPYWRGLSLYKLPIDFYNFIPYNVVTR